jgi:hypothetical protein
MKKNRTYLVPVSILVLAMLACNLQSAGPGTNPGAAATAVAQTVTALVQLPVPGNSATDTPVPATAIPATDTSIPPTTATPTNTPIAASTQVCDNAQFISETIPDGTIENPGAAFTKTWRLMNIGACTWSTSYNVVFVNGNAMSAPSAVPLTGNVAPGQEVDVAVNMQAPTTAGNYTGTWTLRNASGVLFGLGATNGPFWIKISVVAPTATPTATSSGPVVHIPHIPVIPILFLPSTSQVVAQVSVAGSGAGHAVATCPSGSIVTGGGFAASPSMLVFTTLTSSNGWEADAQNLSASSQALNAYAECLSNTAGTTQQVFSQVTAAPNGIGHVVANCPSGSVVTGGGFASSSNLLVYNNSANGNGWEVYAQNTSSSNQLVNAYAICLSGTSGTSQEVVNQVSVAANGTGQSVKACPASTYLTGGGYAGSKNLFVYTESASGSSWQVYAHNTSGGSQLLNSYAVCLTLP